MKILAPFISMKNAVKSLLSDEPKSLSIKRGISAAFAIGILYIIWFFLNKVVPSENQVTLKHFFDSMCWMIFGLLTGATIKDIIAFKNGTPPAKDSDTNTPPQQ